MSESPKKVAGRLARSKIDEGFVPEALHEYTQPDGSPIYWRIRAKHPNGDKWIRPMRRDGDRFVLREPEFPDGKPLYRLHDLVGTASRVIVFEGENCVDALTNLGVTATTLGPADSAASTDWTPLQGRDVTIWPDNDQPEFDYARAVAAQIGDIAETVRVIDVASLGLPGKGDVVDWLQVNPNATANDILTLETGDIAHQSTDDSSVLSCFDDDVKRKSQQTLLIELADGCELFHDKDGSGYAVFREGDHREVWPLRSKGFKEWLSRCFYRLTNTGANSRSVDGAIDTLESKAKYDYEQKGVHLRVAQHDDKIYVDLCDQQWRALEVSKFGWEVLDTPPVMFVRKRGMMPIPEPVRGGTIDELRGFLNVTVEDFPLVSAWLLAALRGIGPYPVLVLQGEQGTAKSTVSRVLRSLIDPSSDDKCVISMQIITKDEVRKYREKRKLVDGVKPATIMRELGVASAAVNWFINDTEAPDISVNPFMGQTVGKRDRRSIKPKEWESITHAEQATIALACDPLTRDIFVFALSTGLRRGEILGLQWDQVDGDELHFTPEESKSGRYDACVMDDEALSIVIRRRDSAECEYVFPKNGKKIRGDVFHHKMWSPARKRADLSRHVQFHDCRRTVGQRILDATGNIVLAQHQLRHADMRTTQRMYAKKPMNLMRDAMKQAARKTTTA